MPSDGPITCEHLDQLSPKACRCDQVWGIHIAVARTSIYHQGSADLIDDAVRHRGVVDRRRRSRLLHRRGAARLQRLHHPHPAPGRDELFGGPGNDTVNEDDGNDSSPASTATTPSTAAQETTRYGDIFDQEFNLAEDDVNSANSDTCNGADGFDAAAYCETTSSIEADITP